MGQDKEDHNKLLAGTRQFQLKIISDYIKSYNQINSYGDLTVIERDLQTVEDIFLTLNREVLSFYDYSLLNDLVESAKNNLRNIPTLKIYLDISLSEGYQEWLRELGMERLCH